MRSLLAECFFYNIPIPKVIWIVYQPEDFIQITSRSLRRRRRCCALLARGWRNALVLVNPDVPQATNPTHFHFYTRGVYLPSVNPVSLRQHQLIKAGAHCIYLILSSFEERPYYFTVKVTELSVSAVGCGLMSWPLRALASSSCDICGEMNQNAH